MRNIYRPNDVDVEPEAVLRKWGVFEIKGAPNTRHFWGFNEVTGDGRVSSPIQSWNAENHTGVTRSGRVYKLVGDAGWDPDASYVYSSWLSLNGLQTDDVTDVSSEYSGAKDD